MNEPTKNEIALMTLAGEASKKREQEEWEWEMKMEKINQNCDIKGELETGGEEE